MSALARLSAAPLAWPETYDRLAGLEGDFTPLQTTAMELQPHHTVLDLGAGSGRLALPAARRVKSVTALDKSRTLLDRLETAAAAENLTNIATLEADWDKLEPSRDLPRHDVVIASRFTPGLDIMKLDAAARELVYVLIFAGPSTRALHRALLEGIAPPVFEPPVLRPGAVTLFNDISELGIEANIQHVSDGFTRFYASEEAAVADFAWLGVEPGLRPLLARNIRRFLIPEDDGVRFLFETRSALIWWRK